MSEEKNENLNSLIKTGSEITGVAAGGALGFLAGGAFGAAAGGTAGGLLSKRLEKLGTEIKKRFLGPREEIRVGAALTFAANKIKENLDAGKKYRNDDFFQS